MSEPAAISHTAAAIAGALGSMDLPQVEKAMCFWGALEMLMRTLEQPGKSPDEIFREYMQEGCGRE